MSIPSICRSSMGWKGFARLGGPSGPVLPYTKEDLAERINLISSQGIHGGGVGSANGVYGSVINIAIGQAEYQGTISGEVFGGTGGFSAAFSMLLSKAIGASSADHTARICGFLPATAIILSPGGGATFQFPNDVTTNAKACVSTFALKGNPGNIVSYDATIMSAGFKILSSSSAVDIPATSEFSYEPVSNSDDDNPVPYYASNFTVLGSGEVNVNQRITDWSITVNNNTYTLYTFNGSNQPTDILQGIMEVNATMQIYSADGSFAFPLTNGATLSLTLGTNNIKSDYIAFSKSPVTSSGGLNQPVYRDIEFMALAKNSSTASLYIV